MSSRKNLRRDAEGGQDMNDRLGNLPEAILGRILSLLPIEDAVRTSILSSTWRFKWALITHLRFSDNKVCASPTKKVKKRKAMFVNFIERVLLLIGNSTIQEFTLRCFFQDHDTNQISKWIVAAMRHDARRIDIQCKWIVAPLAFPCLTNCCAAVEELKLEMNCTIKVVSSITFSSLRVMDLCDITFLNKSLATNTITGSREFELSFTVLEILKFTNCRWKNGHHLLIKAPKLTSITIRDYKKNNRISNAAEYNTCDCKLMITVPKLTKLESCGYTVPCVILIGTSDVKDLSIIDLSDSTLDYAKEKFVKLLRGTPNVKYLKVSSNIIKHDLPKLNKLKQLEVSCAKFDEQITALLCCAPVLEYLIFTQNFKQNHDAAMDLTVPLSILTHLKIAEFYASIGNAGWLEFAKFFLKNAMVLEKIIIHSRRCLTTKEIDELLECPRCSSSAAIKFVGY